MASYGSVLGSSQAESDKLLGQAFVETASFKALVETNDFRVVVGRRGTGKSALYKRISEEYQKKERVVLTCEVPREHAALALQEFFDKLQADYRSTRAAARLLWRGHILLSLAKRLRGHYKLRKNTVSSELESYLDSHPSPEQPETAFEYALRILQKHRNSTPNSLPSLIAGDLDLENLETMVATGLSESGRSALFMFDKLDDGWRPSAIPTALLGGLVLAASDLTDRRSNIHAIAFVRDNMFRALAYFDDDFSRHVEGADLRLRWDGASLLHLIAKRIRLLYNIDAENDVKVWNRFAQRGLEGREGFERCLKNTLYRPRDLIVLLNRAYSIAAAAGRTQVVEEDVDSAARMVSAERLDDLFKEYSVVLPGLKLFAELFRSTKAIWTYGEALVLLDDALENEKYATEEAGDFALLGTAGELFMALYGVGFLGIRSDPTGSYSFCHDGARSDLANVQLSASVAIHPCYWRALDVAANQTEIELVARAYDEYDGGRVEEVRDRRVHQLGQAVEELHRIATGDAGAHAFEDWVLRAVKIVFAGALQNVQHHPNGAAVQRRDIVATNSATKGFWSRVLADYGSRQVVFEVKNFADISLDDVRQALSYSGREYGKLVIIVYRGENEGVSERERAWLQEMYSQHQLLVFLLPAKLLQRFVSKYRGKNRPDYWEQHMTRRLDTHLRNYVNVRSAGRRSR